MRALASVDTAKSLLESGVLLGFLFFIGSLLAAWYYKKQNHLIAFSILAYWLLFSVTSSIFPFAEPVIDYRQYLPSVFLCLIVAIACFSLKPRAVPLAIFAGLTVYFSLASYQINQHWKTEESFWYQSVKYGGGVKAYTSYGVAIAKRNPELAEENFLKAFKLHPNFNSAINLGMLYINQQKVSKGLAIFRQLIKEKPKKAESHYWLSRGLDIAGQKEEALIELKLAADLNPRMLQYQYEVALRLQATGNHQVSIDYLQRVTRFNPDYDQVRFRLGYAYQKTGQYQLALVEYNEFLLTHPRHLQVRFNLAYTYMRLNDFETSIALSKALLQLDPQYEVAHLLLSICYRKSGEEDLALKHEKLYENEG